MTLLNASFHWQGKHLLAWHLPSCISALYITNMGSISLKSESSLLHIVGICTFFSEQFLFPQDLNCCGRIANGTGCCRSERENIVVSWILKAIVWICNIVLEFQCIIHRPGSAVTQIVRAFWFECLLENTVTACILVSMTGHRDTGSAGVSYMCSFWTSEVKCAHFFFRTEAAVEEKPTVQAAARMKRTTVW